MTVLTAAPQADLSPDGMVEVRSPDGKVLGRFRLTAPDPLELEMGVTFDEVRRRRTDPDTVWYTADELAAKLRELRCSP